MHSSRHIPSLPACGRGTRGQTGGQPHTPVTSCPALSPLPPGAATLPLCLLGSRASSGQDLRWKQLIPSSKTSCFPGGCQHGSRRVEDVVSPPWLAPASACSPADVMAVADPGWDRDGFGGCSGLRGAGRGAASPRQAAGTRCDAGSGNRSLDLLPRLLAFRLLRSLLYSNRSLASKITTANAAWASSAPFGCKTNGLPARPRSPVSVPPVSLRHGGTRGSPHEEEEGRPVLLHGRRGV